MKTTSILLAVAFSISTAFAAPMHKDRTHCIEMTECKKMKPLTEEQKQKMQEFKVEVMEYKNSEILPKLTEWKKQLDAAMTPEDLTKLNELREKAEKFRANLAKSVKDMEVGNKDALLQTLKSSKDDMRAIMEELKPLAEKYKGTLENLVETAKPDMEKWKDDIHEIRTEIIIESSTDIEEKADCEKKIRKHHHLNMDLTPMGPMGMKHRGGKAMFMLWNGQSELFDANEESIVSSASDGNVSTSGFTLKQNSPNPANAETSFSFVLDKPATVSLKLYDVNGNEVMTIINSGSFTAGEHTVEGNVRNLSNGTYFYRLTSGSISLQKSMSVTR